MWTILPFHVKASFSFRDCSLGALLNCLHLAPRAYFLWHTQTFLTFLTLFCSELNTILNILIEALRREEVHRSSRMGCTCLATDFLSPLSECFWKAGPFFCLMCIAYHSIWHSGHSNYLCWLKWYIHVSCCKAYLPVMKWNVSAELF